MNKDRWLHIPKGHAETAEQKISAVVVSLCTQTAAVNESPMILVNICLLREFVHEPS